MNTDGKHPAAKRCFAIRYGLTHRQLRHNTVNSVTPSRVRCARVVISTRIRDVAAPVAAPSTTLRRNARVRGKEAGVWVELPRRHATGTALHRIFVLALMQRHARTKGGEATRTMEVQQPPQKARNDWLEKRTVALLRVAHLLFQRELGSEDTCSEFGRLGRKKLEWESGLVPRAPWPGLEASSKQRKPTSRFRPHLHTRLHCVQSVAPTDQGFWWKRSLVCPIHLDAVLAALSPFCGRRIGGRRFDRARRRYFKPCERSFCSLDGGHLVDRKGNRGGARLLKTIPLYRRSKTYLRQHCIDRHSHDVSRRPPIRRDGI